MAADDLWSRLAHLQAGTRLQRERELEAEAADKGGKDAEASAEPKPAPLTSKEASLECASHGAQPHAPRSRRRALVRTLPAAIPCLQPPSAAPSLSLARRYAAAFSLSYRDVNDMTRVSSVVLEDMSKRARPEDRSSNACIMPAPTFFGFSFGPPQHSRVRITTTQSAETRLA